MTAKFNRTEVEGTRFTNHRDFGIVDSRGRKIGASITIWQVEWRQLSDDATCYFHERRGDFALRTQATRDGVKYGSYQGEQWFDTLEARDAAITKYLADAVKRASKR